ncbi:MAG: hypothetical protein WCR20_21600 [Verrucomicrobiota bacterium]
MDPKTKDPKNIALANSFVEALKDQPVAGRQKQEQDSAVRPRGEFTDPEKIMKEAPVGLHGDALLNWHDEAQKNHQNYHQSVVEHESLRDQHINALKNGWGHDPKFINDVASPEGFTRVNAQRAQHGLKPVEAPNPYLAKLNPKTPEAPTAGLQTAPSADMAQQGAGKPLSYETIPKDKRL